MLSRLPRRRRPGHKGKRGPEPGKQFDSLRVAVQRTDDKFPDGNAAHGVIADGRAAYRDQAYGQPSRREAAYGESRKGQNADSAPAERDYSERDSAQGDNPAGRTAHGDGSRGHIPDCDDSAGPAAIFILRGVRSNCDRNQRTAQHGSGRLPADSHGSTSTASVPVTLPGTQLATQAPPSRFSLAGEMPWLTVPPTRGCNRLTAPSACFV